jgi:transposase, IS5 family
MGGKQLGFSDYELTTAKKQTKREKFLSEMEGVVPWQALIALIEPYYPKESQKGGRPPYPLPTMLRIHLLQQWYSLSDPAMEEALIEVPTMRRFAGIELISDRIPYETTILTFRHLLEKHGLGEQIFDTVKAHLSEKGMTIRQGTIVDATLIAAPSSTKNKEGKRAPEMHQTKKGNQWYFGMKVHAGVDKDSGLIHSVVLTAANVHDLTPAAELLHGDEEVVYGDAGYQGIAKRPEMAGKSTEFRVAMRPGKRRALPDTPEGRMQDLIETAKAHIRSKVEHPFRVTSSSSVFRRPACAASLRTAAKSTCWQHCRTCSRPDASYSRQSDRGLGVPKRQDSTSKTSPRPLSMGPKSPRRSPHRQITVKAELLRPANGSRPVCPEIP